MNTVQPSAAAEFDAPMPSHGGTLGLDIGGTSVKGVLMRRGEVVRRSQSMRYQRPDSAQLQHALREAIVPLMVGVSGESESSGTASALIDRVGLCAPGLIDPATTQVQASMNLPSLVGSRLDDLVHGALGRRVSTLRIVSDALAAATDFRAGASPIIEGRLLAISLGTGVGMAVLEPDGTQLCVNPGTSGHIGQIDVSLSDHAPIGPDGGRGSLEAYIGLPALRARHGERLGFVLAKARITDAPLRALVRAIRIMHAIYRAHCVALLGGVGLAIGDSPAAAELHGAISDGLTSLARPGWRLEFARDGHHAAAGAGRLADAQA
jgi:predicted NBD/HSP70 family sugar kinase